MTLVPMGSSLRQVITSIRDTAAMLGRASPRNPMVSTVLMSSAVLILLVAWRIKARRTSLRLMPLPLSDTLMNVPGGPSVSTTISVAPASMAFSISSFTTDAGRSTTSPAAILLIVSSSRITISLSGFTGSLSLQSSISSLKDA
jgi:hypothetical protein